MKRLLAVMVVVSSYCLADINLKAAGTSKGPVSSIDCTTDGGITCGRTTSTSTAQLYCAPASSNSPGCIFPVAQTMGIGAKTFPTSVTTPLLDAGMAVIGSLNLQASAITNINTGTSLVIASATADGTTSSTVGATLLQCTASLTAGDICIDMQDSSGNHLMSVQQGGSVNFSSLVTTPGATAGAAGVDFNGVVGAGAGGSSSVAGGLGGALNLSAGNGGAAGTCIAPTCVAGAGGQVLIHAGDGGLDNVANPGGTGGNVKIVSGSAGPGGQSGNLQLLGGSGGDATLNHTSGLASSISIFGGSGGKSGGGNAASNGAAVAIVGGSGGTDTVNYGAGTGGALSLKSGPGGTAGSGSGASGGIVTLDTGAATGVAGAAALNIGTTNAGTVTIGRSGQSVLLPGTVQVDGSLVATAGNGQAGGSMSASITGLASFHGSTILTKRVLAHPIVASTATITSVVTVAGATGGTYDMLLVDSVGPTTICTKTGISCISSVGVSAAGSCSLPATAAGDILTLQVDTTNCTGTDPALAVDVTW